MESNQMESNDRSIEQEYEWPWNGRNKIVKQKVRVRTRRLHAHSNIVPTTFIRLERQILGFWASVLKGRNEVGVARDVLPIDHFCGNFFGRASIRVAVQSSNLVDVIGWFTLSFRFFSFLSFLLLLFDRLFHLVFVNGGVLLGRFIGNLRFPRLQCRLVLGGSRLRCHCWQSVVLQRVAIRKVLFEDEEDVNDYHHRQHEEDLIPPIHPVHPDTL